MAEAFEVSTDFLLLENVPRNSQIKITDPELVALLEKIEKLTNGDRDAIKRMIRAMVKNQEVKKAMG